MIRAGSVAAVEQAGTVTAPEAEAVNLSGRWVIPGLWDHHVHFDQWTIQQQRIDLSATESAAEVAQLAAQHAADRSEPLVGFGFRDGLWPDTPSREALDEATGSLPAVMIAGDLHCAWLNTAAEEMLGVRAEADGVIRENDWFPALERLQQSVTLTAEQYQQTAQAAAARGVVGVVDFENTDNMVAWPQRVADGVDQLRVEISVWPDRLDQAVAAGLKTGDPVGDSGLITMGPLKVISDGSLNTRTAWCWDSYPGIDPGHPHPCGMATVPADKLVELLRTARDNGIAAAIHAIGDRANTVVLDAFESLGMTGVIEHAQLLKDEDLPRFADLGLTASVQPEHAMDDRDVADAYWAGRTQRAFPLHSLLELGVELRLGSDAPVAPLDPWVAISAAVHRSRGERESWHPEQRISVQAALAASTRGRDTVRAGDLADIAVIEADPFTCDRDQLRQMTVAATLVGGRFTHREI
ncbi:amidohydrolase [Nesterenkonia sedimenti]|uniref:amidohydrolase n=1 Tax=Nesterenkonia sedimenti TaxID=1463632 RepID=UPI0038991CF5